MGGIASSAKLKGSPKNSVIKINNILLQHLKDKLMGEKIHEEQNIKDQ